MMSMGMGMCQRITMRQAIECGCCGTQDWGKHTPECPIGKAQSLPVEDYGKCPVCRKGRIGVNTGDFFECRKCHAVFYAGSIGWGDRTKIYLLDGPGDLLPVYKMDEVGTGEFKWDAYRKDLEEEINIILKGKEEGMEYVRKQMAKLRRKQLTTNERKNACGS